MPGLNSNKESRIIESLRATERRKEAQKMKKMTFIIVGIVLSLVLYSNPVSAQSHGGGHSGGGAHSGGYYGHGGHGYYGHGGHSGGYYHGWYGGWGYRYYPRGYWWGPWGYAYPGWWWPYSGWWWSYPPYVGLYPYYPYPRSYSYPYNMSPPGGTVEPPAYSQQRGQPYYWYYCENPQGYYPYVKSCPGGWTPVEPKPTPPKR